MTAPSSAPTRDRPPAADSTAAAGRATARRLLPLLPLAMMTVVVGVTYLRIVWLLPRGFDWSDESFIMSMIASDRVAVGEPWGFQHLLNPLYRLTGESVLGFRLLRLLGYLAVSGAVVVIARSALRRFGIAIARTGWVFILVFAQVGTFIAWSYPPRYFSHNELASWFSQIGIALILLSLAWGTSPADRRASRILWVVWLAVGAATTVLVFAKVTSGIAFAAVLAVALLVPNTQLRFWQRVAGAAGGGGGTLLLLWITGVPVAQFFDNVLGVATDGAAQAALGHPVAGHLPLYVGSLLTTANTLFPALIAFTLAIALLARRTTEGAAARFAGWDRVAWVLTAFLTVLLLALPRHETWVYLGYLVVFIGAASLIGLAVLGGDDVAMGGSSPRRVATVVVGGGALISAPLIASVGTNAVFAGHFLFTATLWTVALGVTLVLLAERARGSGSRARAVPGLVAALLVLLAAAAVEDSARHPYRMEALASQQTPTSVPELRGLLLTEADAEWIDWVAAAGDSLGADGVPAVAIASPGALYAFNNSGYANPWMDAMWPAAFTSLAVACAEPPSDLFVLQPGFATAEDASAAGTVGSLAACGLDFPGDFAAVAQYVSPDPARAMIIWRLVADEAVGVAAS